MKHISEFLNLMNYAFSTLLQSFGDYIKCTFEAAIQFVENKFRHIFNVVQNLSLSDFYEKYYSCEYVVNKLFSSLT